MDNADKAVEIMKALASKPRIQLLEFIQKGLTHPDEMARALDRGRQTIEQHLEVLRKAGIIEKAPSTQQGKPTFRYTIPEKAGRFLTDIQELLRDF